MVLGYPHVLPGVSVDDYQSAGIAAVALGLLNAIVRPILVVLTIPLTILTLGLFLLVINAAMVMVTAHFIEGFEVAGFWAALVFSIALSIVVSILEALTGGAKKDK